MRLPSSSLVLGLALQASTGIQALRITDKLRVSYYDSGYGSGGPVLVPSYNFSIPVDHFNASDTRVFNNRYWVNDTYYKPGGPVIFCDFGEMGVRDYTAGVLLGGWESNWKIAAMELAKSRNGVLIGWEHRYYGGSNPVPISADEDADAAYGTPIGGAASYKYLTVEQALEDVAYFARRFNQTQLGRGNTVLGGVNATQRLGPSHTPWIWMGGSYPGARGTWMRLRNPDIIYAVWASSAPVQLVPEGSAYANSIYRALPGNCTADMQAALSRIDQIVESGNRTQMLRLAKEIDAALFSSGADDSSKRKRQPVVYPDIEDFKRRLGLMYMLMLEDAQNDGYTGVLQNLCDLMESFDAPTYLSNSTLHPDDPLVFSYNGGGAQPSAKGIAASNGDRGAEAAVAAYLFGIRGYLGFDHSGNGEEKRSLRGRLSRSKRSSSSDGYLIIEQDEHSWEWQVLSELGLIVSVNGSSPYRLGSKFIDYEYMRNETMNHYFSEFSEADFPPRPNNDYIMGFGGWRMQPSNTMFTNGEFDPWRAYGVASLDSELADYPTYKGMRQDIPKCGVSIDESTGQHFGLIYPGAVHAEDEAMLTYGDPTDPSQNVTDPPMKVGLELFQKALDVWLPCFNDSSSPKPNAIDPNHPATSTDGTDSNSNSTNPHKNGVAPGLSASKAVWAFVGVCSLAFYVAL